MYNFVVRKKRVSPTKVLHVPYYFTDKRKTCKLTYT